MEISRQASELWPLVGPDFVERMLPVQAEDNVIRPQFNVTDQSEALAPRQTWRAVSQRIRETDPALHRAWIANLTLSGQSDSELVLKAPTKFAAHYINTHLWNVILQAVSAEMGHDMRVVVTASWKRVGGLH